MVSFSFLAAAFAAFAAVSEASYRGHMAKRHLHMRYAYGNLTDVYPTSIGTGSPAPGPVTTSIIPDVAGTPEQDYTTTLAQTITKCLTVTYTLGSGKEVVTTITKYETTAKTIAHVKATLTVAPVVESAPVVSPVSASSTLAPVVSSPVPSSGQSTRTSTTTSYATAPASGTLTVTGAPTCPSVETVYVPTYITIYNTVTAGAPVPSTHNPVPPPYQNSTTRSTTTRTSTTTVSIFKTVTLSTSSVPTAY
ncbi:hypothetical protein HOY82DRAFT_540688 [Tuber indicum]|nr:hypothetical protein HOY82DRAFT_540688 [Tuber indicum]